MITWLSNVLTGRFRHWNVANNRYLSTLVERAKTFPPAIAPFFVELTRASYLVVDFLLGPDQGSKAIIKKDVRSITPEQFRSLHRLNIWTQVALFGQLNPDLRDSFFAACDDFVGTTEREQRIVSEVLRMEKIDVVKVCRSLLASIKEILDYRVPDAFHDAFDWVRFHSLFCTAGAQAIKAYKDEVAKLN